MTNERTLVVDEVELAFNRHQSNSAKVGIVFLGGFASDKEGSKALALESLAIECDFDFLRFDYLGHGRSGGDFKTQGCISRWLRDAIAMLDEQTSGPQVLVGSSMGGWIALLLACRRPERVKAIVGIAAAADFAIELTPEKLGSRALKEIQDKGVYYEDTPYGPDPYIWTKLLFEDAKSNQVLTGSLRLPCPLNLIQGKNDPDVPWQHALKTLEKVSASKANLTLIEDGDHRLSRDSDIELICEIVERCCSE